MSTSDAPAAASNLDVAALTDGYRQMCRIRAFEEQAIVALRDGDVPGPIHPSIGQEAAAVGVVGNLREDDVLLSTHRGHGHTLVKGASPLAMMRELLGRDGGSCGGKGGSMHIADFSVGMLGANGVVGANILIAAGAAHAIKLRRENKVVVCVFGDGAVNRGPFLEGLNWAKVFHLPVLFVCEDNTYAATTRTAAVTAGAGAGARARSLGLPTREVDGNDLLVVDDAAADLIDAVRAGNGPRLLVAHTYRLTGHTAADPAKYRSEAEVAEQRERDPVTRCARWLQASGVTVDTLERIAANAETEMTGVLRDALATPWPVSSEALSDVQDVGSPVGASGASS